MSQCHAQPCPTIGGSFPAGRFERIAEKVHPGESRLYTRVLTPGTLVDESLLDEAAPNLVAALHFPDGSGSNVVVLATAEVSTGAVGKRSKVVLPLPLLMSSGRVSRYGC